MSLSNAQPIASAEVCGEAPLRLRVASDLTQADTVERSEDATGMDQFVRIERVTWPLLSKQCTAVAKAIDLIAESETQFLLPALIEGHQSAGSPCRTAPESVSGCMCLRRNLQNEVAVIWTLYVA